MGSPDLAVYQGHLALALEYHWQVSHDPEDLHEALRTSVAPPTRTPTSARTGRTCSPTCAPAPDPLRSIRGSGDLDAALAALLHWVT